MALIEFKDLPNKTTPINARNLNNNFNEILNLVCPVGKVEIFYDNDDHSNYLGFTWERTGIGKAIVGIDSSDTDFNTIGKNGGEKTHILTINEMPKHNHKTTEDGYGFMISDSSVNVASGNQQYSNNAVRDNTSSTGGSQAHNNMPPYQVFAIWKRIS